MSKDAGKKVDHLRNAISFMESAEIAGLTKSREMTASYKSLLNRIKNHPVVEGGVSASVKSKYPPSDKQRLISSMNAIQKHGKEPYLSVRGLKLNCDYVFLSCIAIKIIRSVGQHCFRRARMLAPEGIGCTPHGPSTRNTSPPTMFCI